MRKEYDFSKAVRGKFYRPDAKFSLPVYLDDDVLEYFTAKADAKGVEVDTIINTLLKRDIDIIESTN